MDGRKPLHLTFQHNGGWWGWRKPLKHKKVGGWVAGSPFISHFDVTEDLKLYWRDVEDGRGHLAGEETGIQYDSVSNPWQD